jgi:hypothetical protein
MPPNRAVIARMGSHTKGWGPWTSIVGWEA